MTFKVGDILRDKEDYGLLYYRVTKEKDSEEYVEMTVFDNDVAYLGTIWAHEKEVEKAYRKLPCLKFKGSQYE